LQGSSGPCFYCENTRLTKALEAQGRELAAYRTDAERYRWLRVNGYAIDLDSIWLVCKTVQDVDRYIDAARAAGSAAEVQK
jgi:hypothetical protein